MINNTGIVSYYFLTTGALELAQEVFKQEGLKSNSATWLQMDITQQKITVNENQSTTQLCQYQVVASDTFSEGKNTDNVFSLCLDKGTYDAISLCPDNAQEKRRHYIRRIENLLEKNGWFLITSCNWTASELRMHFSNLSFIEELPAPTFVFGGKQGKTVSTCAFRKS